MTIGQAQARRRSADIAAEWAHKVQAWAPHGTARDGRETRTWSGAVTRPAGSAPSGIPASRTLVRLPAAVPGTRLAACYRDAYGILARNTLRRS